MLYVPGILALITLNALPSLLAEKEDVTLLRMGYLAVPLFLAFAPQVSISRLPRLRLLTSIGYPSRLGRAPHFQAICAPLIPESIPCLCSGLIHPSLEVIRLCLLDPCASQGNLL